jgi:shikimate kinase
MILEFTMKVYLIGYMASGKTKLGRDLSVATGLQYLDLDEVFEERYRIGIVDFFEKYGDEAFRKIEQKLLKETADLDDVVVATGGGTACSEENMEFIRSNGISIYIKLDVEELYLRLKAVRKKRPLLMNVAAENLLDYIRGHLKQRERYYLMAAHVVEGPLISVDPLVEIIRQTNANEDHS